MYWGGIRVNNSKGRKVMTKRELEDIESLLIDVEESDDKIVPIENLYFHVLKLYRSQCEKKLGYNPLV